MTHKWVKYENKAHEEERYKYKHSKVYLIKEKVLNWICDIIFLSVRNKKERRR